MRLFLSSENLGNYPEVFLDLLGSGNKLALVHNAIDDWKPKERKEKIEAHQKQLISQGFQPTEIDLRDYFNKPAELEEYLNEFDGIFVFGGNTFILRRAFSLSGLATILPRFIKEDRLAYGGSSAGSIIPTPSLRGTELGDDPYFVPAGYPEEIIWDGLNIVDFYVVPHYESDWFREEAEAMKQYFDKEKLAYYLLKDGQVLLVSNEGVKLLA